MPSRSRHSCAACASLALITPSPARVTATLSVSEEMFSVTLLFASVRLPAALPMAQVTLLALVLPSEWYENAPISVLEAYALGRPVIGARIGGIPEMIREGETGIMAASGDYASLANALSAMTSLGSTGRTAMGRTGRSWMASEFSAASFRDRTLALYRELGAG